MGQGVKGTANTPGGFCGCLRTPVFIQSAKIFSGRFRFRPAKTRRNTGFLLVKSGNDPVFLSDGGHGEGTSGTAFIAGYT